MKTISYGITGAEYTHEGECCTFVYLVNKHQLTDPAIQQIAAIVYDENTDAFKLAPQVKSLWAISAGLSHNYQNDHEMLAAGTKLYDTLV